MGKSLIVIGLVLILCGVLITYGGKLDFFGKLPGDIVIERENTTFYIPITSCLLISVLLSLLFFLYEKLR
ncbi:DUF2905 domain-containing protein [Marinoscillum furvescens]|uniref:DUF2905 family protein n=1 Tax=Marinoscillum furvescens DSM 4134 TaxID=1122208 RepID=A0A3D9L837_MARFU|nr:DUF2905 domain-containing protein [Marinoscillum furvescens]REE01673.1 hypothetical protein C7460_103190 [Marinoscillum furvescens DSM 4134]